MGKNTAFFFQLSRALSSIVCQDTNQFVAEQMPVPLPLATEVHGLESSDLECPVAKTGSSLKLLEFPPHGHARFLHHHFGIVQIG